MKAKNIKWDIDEGDDVCLPEQIDIPDEVIDEAISDYISDSTGFCHKGFDVVGDRVKYGRITRGGISKQQELYEVLACKTGEEVLELLIEWHGMKLLSDEFCDYLQRECIIDQDEEGCNETY